MSDVAHRLKAASIRMFRFDQKTRATEEELINIRRELSRVLQNLMGDFYREEASGAPKKKQTNDRCVAGLNNSGSCEKLGHQMWHLWPCKDMFRFAYDRCRRYQGHEGLHLPDCGGAFDDEGNYTKDWIPIFDEVEEAGGIFK